MDVIQDYLNKCRALTDTVESQKGEIQRAAGWFADSILAGRMVHIFGSGHSRIMVEEMWPRYGSFPGFNPIVELSLTLHNLVVGANGQRQAMFLENVSGLAERILFPGEIPADQLPQLMRALSLVVQLPRYEGYGMVPLEGMASGVPFVASDAGDYRAFSAQGRSGVIAPEEAAEAARALLSDAERHAAMSRAARELAVTSFSARAEADGIGAVYERLWAEDG